MLGVPEPILSGADHSHSTIAREQKRVSLDTSSRRAALSHPTYRWRNLSVSHTQVQFVADFLPESNRRDTPSLLRSERGQSGWRGRTKAVDPCE